MKSILFFGPKNDPHCEAALAFCRAAVPDTTPILGNWGDRFPEEECSGWEQQSVISFNSRWIIPAQLLRGIAVNFHPGPPEYRGIGCLNYALYDGAASYGVCAHGMMPEPDAGTILAVKRFPILYSDTVATLLRRTHDYQLALFYDVLAGLLCGEYFYTGEQWSGELRGRKDLDALATLTPDMSAEEIERRKRATTFGKWKPRMVVNGVEFEAA